MPGSNIGRTSDFALEPGPVLAVQVHEVGRNPDRLGLRVRLQDGPAPDDLLALGERAIGHGDLAVREPQADAILARQQPAGVDKRAILERLLTNFPIAAIKAGRGGLSRYDSEWRMNVRYFMVPPVGSIRRRTDRNRIDMSPFWAPSAQLTRASLGVEVTQSDDASGP